MKNKELNSFKPKTLPCGRPLPDHSKSKGDNEALYLEMKAKLVQFVQSKDLKRTEAREKILETIIYESRHFRLNDLLDRLRDRYPEIGRATLYRNIPIFVECGIIQEGPTDSDGQAFYELQDGAHHDHIICSDCHKIFEFHDVTIEKRQDSVLKQLKFAPQKHQHIIYAGCDYFGSH